MSPRILALDPSLTSTGVCTEAGPGVLAPPARLAGVRRLAWLRNHILGLAAHADMVVIEGYAYNAGHQAHQVGELGGVLRLALWEAGHPYAEVAPASLKQAATGKGNASKDAVLCEAVRRLGYTGTSKDAAEANWLWAMAMDHYGAPVVTLPKQHRAAITKVAWPALPATMVAP